MKSQIKITSNRIFDGSISPFIYGEFVEFINDMIPGMWADRLRDRSFEGLTEPAMFYRKEKDFPRQAWRELRLHDAQCGELSTNDAEGIAFDLDPRRPLVGTRSARIHFGGTRGSMRGIIQDNVGVREGERLRLEVFLRGKTLAGKVHAFIGREYGVYSDRYDEVVFDDIGPEWRRFTGELTSPVADPGASFAIVLDAPGTLWVDKVSLMPADNRAGWRSDVVDAVKALKPGIIRFGGSSLIYYDWRKGIGPRAQRAPFLNKPWNNTEENDVGLDEFLRFCELVEAEPLICANSNSAKPQEIAQQVEYTNGSTETQLGRLRAENGHPEPYAVKYWQIGNEQTGETYEKSLLDYAHAMREVDPSIILLASFPTENIINRLSAEFDFICPHFYEPDMNLHYTATDELRAAIRVSPSNPRLTLGITEWNHTAGDWGDSRAWLQTLFNGIFVARMLNHFQRNGDLIRMANRSNLVNSCYSGSIQTNPLDIYFTPAYYVQKLYSNMSGKTALEVKTDDADLDVSATMDLNPNRVMVWVVNPQSQIAERSIVLHGIGSPRHIKTFTITGSGPDAVNSFERKHSVVPVEENVKPSETVRRAFPAHSVTGMEFQLA